MIFGKPLSAYLRFAGPFILLILAVGIARTFFDTRWWLSMNVVLWFGTIYLAIRTHTSGFGSYKQLLPAIFTVNATEHIVAITGIVIGIVTGQDNIYSVPEAFFGNPGNTWTHVGAHLFVGMIIGTLFPWLIGCLVLFITKKVTRGPARLASHA
jgi:hypothetical protein